MASHASSSRPGLRRPSDAGTSLSRPGFRGAWVAVRAVARSAVLVLKMMPVPCRPKAAGAWPHGHAGQCSNAPMSKPAPRGRVRPLKSMFGASSALPASIAGEPDLR